MSTAGRLLERDDELHAFYDSKTEAQEGVITVDGRQVAQRRTIAALTCKGEGCGYTVEVVLKNGVVPTGWRNAMLAHGRKHAPGAWLEAGGRVVQKGAKP